MRSRPLLGSSRSPRCAAPSASKPDYLLSGINLGPNTGQAVLHSGTVGAAMTAATYGIPAAAFSLDSGESADAWDWDTASAVAAEILPALDRTPPGIVLNVNIPNAPGRRVRGVCRAHLAAAGAVQLSIGEAAAEHTWTSRWPNGRARPAPGTDSALLAAGYAAVTALRPVCEAPSVDLPWPAGQRGDPSAARPGVASW